MLAMCAQTFLPIEVHTQKMLETTLLDHLEWLWLPMFRQFNHSTDYNGKLSI